MALQIRADTNSGYALMCLDEDLHSIEAAAISIFNVFRGEYLGEVDARGGWTSQPYYFPVKFHGASKRILRIGPEICERLLPDTALQFALSDRPLGECLWNVVIDFSEQDQSGASGLKATLPRERPTHPAQTAQDTSDDGQNIADRLNIVQIPAGPRKDPPAAQSSNHIKNQESIEALDQADFKKLSVVATATRPLSANNDAELKTCQQADEMNLRTEAESARRTKHEKVFAAVKNANSIDAIETFLVDYPESHVIAEAKELRSELLARNVAYKTAIGSNDPKVLRSFLFSYPKSPEAEYVQARLDSAEWISTTATYASADNVSKNSEPQPKKRIVAVILLVCALAAGAAILARTTQNYVPGATSKPVAQSTAKSKLSGVSDRCDNLVRQWKYENEERPASPEWKRFLLNKFHVINNGTVNEPTLACSDADVYEQVLQQKWVLKESLILDCNRIFGPNTANPDNRNSYVQNKAQEFYDFRRDKSRICQVASEMLKKAGNKK